MKSKEPITSSRLVKFGQRVSYGRQVQVLNVASVCSQKVYGSCSLNQRPDNRCNLLVD